MVKEYGNDISRDILQRDDTTDGGDLYLSFKLGEQRWTLTLSNGRRSPSRHTVAAGDTAAVAEFVREAKTRSREWQGGDHPAAFNRFGRALRATQIFLQQAAHPAPVECRIFLHCCDAARVPSHKYQSLELLARTLLMHYCEHGFCNCRMASSSRETASA